MADFLSTSISFIARNLPYIAIAVGFVIFLFWIVSKYSKSEDKFKPIVLEKEIKKDFNEVFKLTQEPVGYGKTLYIGSRQAGFVMKSIYVNFYIKKDKPELKRTANVTKLIKKHPSVKEVMNTQEAKIFNGFKVCGKSRVSRFLANFFDIGTRIFLVDKEIVTETESTYNVNPYSTPQLYFGIWIYSNIGRKLVDEIAYKVNQMQMLDSMVNYLPKLSFHELEQSKQKAQFDIFEEMQKKKRKEQLEEIKKA